jgi:rubredoxin
MFRLWMAVTLTGTAVAVPLVLLGLWNRRRRASRWHCPSCGSRYAMDGIAGELGFNDVPEGGGFVMRCPQCCEERSLFRSGKPVETSLLAEAPMPKSGEGP